MTAPLPGQSAEFDDLVRKTREGLDAAGNPDRVDDTTLRETLARAFAKHGGKTFGVDPNADNPFLVEEDEQPVVRQVRELRIPEPPAEPYWYEDPDEAAFIEHYVLSRRALGPRLHGGLLITGPSGQGKTLGVAHAIESINAKHGLSLTLLTMHCPTVTDPQKWFGRREIDASGSRYEKSDFIKAVESPDSVILLDEIKRLHPTIHNPIMGLLNGTESVLLSDLNLDIVRNPSCIFIATTNEGAAFGGNHRMDYAMEERWPFRVERGFPPHPEEIAILTRNTGIDPDAADVLVTVAEDTRRMWETGDLRAPISTRTLVAASWLVASGYSERSALVHTALGLYEGGAGGSVGQETEREKVKRAIESVGR